jgi:hypothetical protein
MQEKNKEQKIKYDILKKVLASFSKEAQEQVKEKEIEEIRSKIKDTIEPLGKETKEILVKFGVSVEKLKKIKEEKEVELNELKNKNQELENKTEKLHEIVVKKDELEKMKSEFVEKRSGRFLSKVGKIQSSLNSFLVAVRAKILLSDNSLDSTIEKEKEYLLKREKENSYLANLLDELSKKQVEISLLEAPWVVFQQTQIVATSSESGSKEVLVHQVDKNKVQLGIPTP